MDAASGSVSDCPGTAGGEYEHGRQASGAENCGNALHVSSLALALPRSGSAGRQTRLPSQPTAIA